MDEKLLETESGLIGTETIGQKEEKIRYKWKESKELSERWQENQVEVVTVTKNSCGMIGTEARVVGTKEQPEMTWQSTLLISILKKVTFVKKNVQESLLQHFL